MGNRLYLFISIFVIALVISVSLVRLFGGAGEGTPVRGLDASVGRDSL